MTRESAMISCIHDDLEFIKTELTAIREEMVDKDMVLSANEVRLLEKSIKNEKKGKLVSGKQLRKELGI